MSLAARLRGWAAALAAAGVRSPDADARWIVAYVLGCTPAELALAADPSAEQLARIEDLVRRRRAREPLQHLLGTAPFLDLELSVGPGVFVPRPETEVLADHAIRWLQAQQLGHPVVVDLCAGSGALALVIACHVPGARVTAVERSPEALVYARRNATSSADRVAGAGATLRVLAGDASDVDLDLDLGSRVVDTVVANPPYVPAAAVPRDPEVRDHDPAAALFGGPDGFDVVRPMLRLAARLLRPGGLLAVEHGDEQGGPDGLPGLVAGVRDNDGHPAFRNVEDHHDLAGRPRFTSALRT